MAKDKKSENANLMAAASYFLMPLSSIVIYLMEKENKYVRFHAFQGILLGIVLWVISWVLGFMFAMMTIATLGMGFAFGGMIMMLFWLVFLVIWLYMMWKAYSGEKIVLPVIGEIAEKNA